MQTLFDAIIALCGKIQIISDLFWDFPTNFEWYANIPVLGNFSLAIILLIGSGIYFFMPFEIYPGKEIPSRYFSTEEQ